MNGAGRAPAARPKDWRTPVLGVTAGGSVVVLFVAELTRVWRLGTLPLSRGGTVDGERKPRWWKILREGYRVSSTRENALVNLVGSFIWTFGWTRLITWSIRTRGRLGPIRNIETASGRHIHHFVPGMAVSLIAGGWSIASRRQEIDRWLALPFGFGAALVADETALLLELEDVYWSEEGTLSIQVAFASIALLGALAYAARVLSRGKPSLEADWEQAAAAFDSLQLLPGHEPGR